MTRWEVDISGAEQIADYLEEYGPKATEVIQEYLKSDAWERITAGIPGFIHASGRSWKGKKTAATSAKASSAFHAAALEGMTITIRTQTRYNYLYFPDDGSNTKHHAGNQGFMLQGAETVSGTIVSELAARLTAAFEEA